MKRLRGWYFLSPLDGEYWRGLPGNILVTNALLYVPLSEDDRLAHVIECGAIL